MKTLAEVKRAIRRGETLKLDTDTADRVLRALDVGSETIDTPAELYDYVRKQLSQTSILSADFKSEILGWIQNAHQIAYEAGIEEGKKRAGERKR